MKNLSKEIKGEYPNLSDELASTIMLNVFKYMAELKFPFEGDDKAFVEWFNTTYTPYMKNLEEASRQEDWY